MVTNWWFRSPIHGVSSTAVPLALRIPSCLEFTNVALKIWSLYLDNPNCQRNTICIYIYSLCYIYIHYVLYIYVSIYIYYILCWDLAQRDPGFLRSSNPSKAAETWTCPTVQRLDFLGSPWDFPLFLVENGKYHGVNHHSWGKSPLFSQNFDSGG
jgi:hypothetical protein